MPFTLHPENDPDPVRRYTSPQLLEEIEQRLERNIRFYAAQPAEIVAARIEDLKREWSIERYMQVHVSVVAFMTAFFALTKKRGWAVITCTALGFFLYHALRGYYPPLPILRQLGARTRGEIDRELYALKALRGDFNTLPRQEGHEFNVPAEEIMDAVNA